MITSSVLNSTLLQFLNQLCDTLVTAPDGSTPHYWSNGTVNFQDLDCSAIDLRIVGPPKTGGLAQVTFTFPGSQISTTGYISLAKLEALMNTNAVQSTNSGQLSGSVVSQISPAISKLKSGQVLVQATITGSESAQSPATMSLYRDGSTLLKQIKSVPGGAAGMNVAGALIFLDTLPDGEPHTYTVQASSESGTLTTSIGGANIIAVEL